MADICCVAMIETSGDTLTRLEHLASLSEYLEIESGLLGFLPPVDFLEGRPFKISTIFAFL